MEGFFIRGWDLVIIIPGWYWLHKPHPISDELVSRMGKGFHTVRGGIDPGDRYFRPRYVGVADIWKDF